MKRKKDFLRHRIGLFFISVFLSISCQKNEILIPASIHSMEFKDFPLSQAKGFIQSSGLPSALSSLPGIANLTKSASLPLSATLQVQWTEYFAYEDDRSLIYELPIDLGSSIQGALIQKNGSMQKAFRENVKIESRLVVQKFKKDKHVRRFVFMAIGISSVEKTSGNKSTPTHFTGNRKKFEGYLVFSDEHGAIQEAFYYKNEKRRSVSITYQPVSDPLRRNSQGYVIYSHLQTKNDMPGGDGEVECYYCGRVTDGSGICNHCGGGVYVVDDPIYCHVCGFYKGQCRCCHICGWYPCSCNEGGDGDRPGSTRCPDCLSEHCNGECRYLPPEPSEPVVKNYTLSLIASGNGNVTGGGTYEAGYTANINAYPGVENVFGGWAEGGAILSMSTGYSVGITGARCLTGYFHPTNSDCGKIATKYHANNAFQTIIRTIYLLKKINPYVEFAYTLDHSNNWTAFQDTSSARITFDLTKKYDLYIHNHPNESPIPSEHDFIAMYQAYDKGVFTEGSRMITQTNNGIMSIEIADGALFKEFIWGCFCDGTVVNSKRIKSFNHDFSTNILKITSTTQLNEPAVIERAIKYFSSGLGLKVAFAPGDGLQKEWAYAKVENGNLLFDNCIK